MPSIIDVSHQAVTDMLRQLVHQVGSTASILPALGEDMVERTKQRFASGTAPDGQRWIANTRTTLMRYLQEKNGFSKKTGKIGAKGRALAMSKKPLIVTGTLAKEIYYDVADDSLTLGATKKYAAMQQYGGKRSQFKQLWGDIPARPFLPIDAKNELFPREAEFIVEQLSEYLMK
jgi:phage virion morphogenesis protein